MRFERVGLGCEGDPSCPCMPNSGMASGINVASTLPGIPYDRAFGAFDTSMATITFPQIPAVSNGMAQAGGLQVIPSPDGTYSVTLGTQTLASGLSQPQAQDFVAQNAPGAAVMAANPVAANVLSGNPLQPSIVGTDDGSQMIAPQPAPPSAMCSFASAVNGNPLLAIAAVAGAAWLVSMAGKHRRGR